MKKCDIIIPVYNAYEYVVECIESVKKYTDLRKHNLIIINDASPDKRISRLLKKIKSDNKSLNINVLTNNENLGFVKTVNKGMRISKNDVILLNSDTEVTQNWIEKMIDCAYSNSEIATVTPLTNNGTLASVPNFLEDNEIPSKYTIEEYSEIIEKCSFKKYPTIPTGVGFCMLIKRNVLDLIGLFDEQYGKGYGEETDFCYRAIEYGFINVLCDDTFIFHKGTQSFKNIQNEIYYENMKKLIDNYTLCNDRTNKFLGINPIQFIQDNIKLNLDSKKLNVLYTIHSWFRCNDTRGVGGTTLHLYDLINENRKKQNSFVLVPNGTEGKYTLFCYFENYETVLEYEINVLANTLNFYSKEYEEFLEKIIKYFKINLIHVQHTIGHSFSIGNVIKKLNIPSMITIHDFFYFCPSIHLLYKMDYYCKNNTELCKDCINNLYGINNNIINKWRDDAYKYLKIFDTIVTPSEDTKRRYLEVYKDVNIKVITHGVEKPEVDYIPTVGKKINVAFIGMLRTHKGLHILEKCIEQQNNNIVFHMFGMTDNPYLNENHSGYIYHGLYEKEELPNLLKDNNINLVCLFSIWPETYSYTLTESLLAHIPVICFNIGAIADRVNDYKCGYIIDLESTTQEIINLITDIKQNPNEYNKLVQNILKLKIKSKKQMSNEYTNIYSSLYKEVKTDFGKEQLYLFLKEGQAVKKISTVNNETINQYQYLIKIYEKMKSYKLFRIIIKIVKKIMIGAIKIIRKVKGK